MTKCEMMELIVISEHEFAICSICGHQGSSDANVLQHLHERCIYVRRRGVQCLQKLGYPPDTDEAMLQGVLRVQVVRG